MLPAEVPCESAKIWPLSGSTVTLPFAPVTVDAKSTNVQLAPSALQRPSACGFESRPLVAGPIVATTTFLLAGSTAASMDWAFASIDEPAVRPATAEHEPVEAGVVELRVDDVLAALAPPS